MRARTVGTIITCMVVIALLAVPAVFVNTAVGYLAPIAALVMLVLCFVYLMLLKRSLEFEERGPDDGSTRGEVLQFSLIVRNRSILPATRIEARFAITDLFGDEGRFETRLITLPPRSEKVFDLGVRFDHIGTYQVGITRIATFDPLGIFYSTQVNNDLHTVLIEPRTVDIADMEISDQSLQESSKNIKTFINDGMDYSGVRDYQWGDPIKSIHWKLSSKSSDSYFTRLYETPTTPGVALFMDFESPSYVTEILMAVNDAVVESMASVEFYAASKGYETEIFFVDGSGSYQHIAGPLERRYTDLMDRIPLIGVGTGSTMLELLRRESNSIYCQNNLIVCTSSITDELISTLIGLDSPTRSPYLIAIIPSDGEGVEERRIALRRLGSARIPYAVICGVGDLVGVGE